MRQSSIVCMYKPFHSMQVQIHIIDNSHTCVHTNLHTSQTPHNEPFGIFLLPCMTHACTQYLQHTITHVHITSMCVLYEQYMLRQTCPYIQRTHTYSPIYVHTCTYTPHPHTQISTYTHPMHINFPSKQSLQLGCFH